jgi:hypothetical protein
MLPRWGALVCTPSFRELEVQRLRAQAAGIVSRNAKKREAELVVKIGDGGEACDDGGESDQPVPNKRRRSAQGVAGAVGSGALTVPENLAPEVQSKVAFRQAEAFAAYDSAQGGGSGLAAASGLKVFSMETVRSKPLEAAL